MGACVGNGIEIDADARRQLGSGRSKMGEIEIGKICDVDTLPKNCLIAGELNPIELCE
jgi:hypothetical protein